MKKFLLLTLAVLCLCGCGKEKEEVSQLKIDLKSNGTIGYEWKCDVDGKNIAKLVSSNYVQDKVEKTGGTYKFIFEGIDSGMTTITCKYQKSTDNLTSLYEVEYVIQVDSKTKEIVQYSTKGTYLEEVIPDAITIKTTK